jgi:hypothetical protein
MEDNMDHLDILAVLQQRYGGSREPAGEGVHTPAIKTSARPPRAAPHCRRCALHGVLVACGHFGRDHTCPWRLCPCPSCAEYVVSRRSLNQQTKAMRAMRRVAAVVQVPAVTMVDNSWFGSSLQVKLPEPLGDPVLERGSRWEGRSG